MSSPGPRGPRTRVVLADNEDVIVPWYQRAVGHDGRRLDTPVLGLCHVRNGRLARAQMFYFGTAGVVRFSALPQSGARPP
jgi:ketosteroid isomerase-like protein